MLEKGAHLKIVQERLGNKSISTIYDIYVRTTRLRRTRGQHSRGDASRRTMKTSEKRMAGSTKEPAFFILDSSYTIFNMFCVYNRYKM